MELMHGGKEDGRTDEWTEVWTDRAEGGKEIIEMNKNETSV